MAYVEALGYLAGGLVLAAFCMPSIVPLRILAILSNLAFVGYAWFEELMPVLVLHAVLLPVNVYRLAQAVQVASGNSERIARSDRPE